MVFFLAEIGTLLFMEDLKALGAEMPEGVFGQMRAPFFAITGEPVVTTRVVTSPEPTMTAAKTRAYCGTQA